MRLFRSEWLRARSRRLVAMLVIGGVVATVVSMTIAAITSTPASESAIQSADARYQKELARCLQGAYSEPGGQLPVTYDSLEDYCEDRSGPYLGSAGVWLHDLPDVLMNIATFVILLAAWLGASLAGADWTSNTMATLLTWEPRRPRVFATRAVVVALVVAIFLLFQLAFFSLVYTGVASLFGTTPLSPPHLWGDVARVIGRICVLGTAVGLVAYAIAMVGRSTVSSLGALFGYLVLFEGVIAGFKPTIQGYLFGRAIGVVVFHTPIVHYPESTNGFSSSVEPEVLLDVQRAWAVVAVYVVGLLVLALVVFRRRDVN